MDIDLFSGKSSFALFQQLIALHRIAFERPGLPATVRDIKPVPKLKVRTHGRQTERPTAIIKKPRI